MSSFLQTFPGQGENPFIFAQTGSPILNLWAVIALFSNYISLKISQTLSDKMIVVELTDNNSPFSDHEYPEDVVAFLIVRNFYLLFVIRIHVQRPD